MKFAHLADCHIGSWRDPKLRDISTKAFLRAIDICLEKGVDFILISGDLFNTSLPTIDRLKETVIKLKEIRDANIPVYVIAGSHDFSPSGKTMLDVLEQAGLFINVVKGKVVDDKLKLNFTVDEKTGAKITGMLGKKGMLEKSYYENLDKSNLEDEDGYKIFMFHSALTEFKPKELENMDSHPLSLLPKKFDYYAGGHVHERFQKNEKDYGMITYPGALFPNNFSELEKYGGGGFYIVEDGNITFEPIQIYNVHSINLDCNHYLPEQVETELKSIFNNQEFFNTIVTIRLSGVLKGGKPSDINFREIFSMLYDKNAYFVMKNTTKLNSEEFEEVKIDISSIDDIESALIKEHLNQIKINGVNVEEEEQMTKALVKHLNKEKEEGERVLDFDSRVFSDVKKLLKIEYEMSFN